MIQSWKGREAEAIFLGRTPKGVSAELAKRARRTLAQLNAAERAEDMGAPPGNRLHKVGSAWAVRVNDQFRVTFTWGPQGPEDVWFGDYH